MSNRYVWEKHTTLYEIVESGHYFRSYGEVVSNKEDASVHVLYTTGTGYTFDPNTGDFSLKNVDYVDMGYQKPGYSYTISSPSPLYFTNFVSSSRDIYYSESPAKLSVSFDRLYDPNKFRAMYTIRGEKRLSSERTKGKFLGYVSSDRSNKYPTDGVLGEYWYKKLGYDTIDPKSISIPSKAFYQDSSIVVKINPGNIKYGNVIYDVEYSIDDSEWIEYTSTSELSLNYSIPKEATKVKFRVKARDTIGFTSTSYVTSRVCTILNNNPPSVPGTITIPSTILANKSFQISWGASTDTEGNLTGYKLERSVNSGSSWTQIYQGPATSYTDTVSSGTPSVTYRVKAYDSYNAESGYRKSNTVGVINNRPPESPASITIPELILGGQPSLIKWEASNDEDQNLVGYELERQLNNTGGFTRIYKGSELQYTDTVEKGTLQVQYRVRAYDSYNAYSEYTTSSLKEVNNNTLPTITGEDTDLGTLESVSYKYTVTDPDEGQTLNVTEYIDDKVHKTLEVTSGVENTLTIDGEEFLQVGKGSHTIVISVDDGQGVLVKRTLTFTRVQTKLSTTLITPLPANEMPTRMYAFIFGNIPAEAIFHFYACNNAFDEEPTWQEVTEEVLMKKKFYFANKTKTAEQWGVNVKFEVDRSTVPEGTEIYVSKVTGGFDGYSTQS